MGARARGVDMSRSGNAPDTTAAPGAVAPGSTAPGRTAPGRTAPGSTAAPAGAAHGGTGDAVRTAAPRGAGPPSLRRLPVPPPTPQPVPPHGPGGDTAPPTRGALALVPSEPGPPPAVGEVFGAPTAHGTVPDGIPSDHSRWVAGFVWAALEVTAGRRPIAQLVRWSSDEVRRALRQRRVLALRAHGVPVPADPAGPGPGPVARPRILSVRSCAPCPGVIESSVIVADGKRIRAVAVRVEEPVTVRVEEPAGRRQVTALEIG